MDKSEHGQLLRRAIKVRGLSRTTVADATNVKPRTVTNWTSGETMPSERERDALRALLGPYDTEGDAVEVALAMSELADFRRSRVLSVYQEQLHEQARESRAR